MSLRKQVRLADSEKEKHTIVFRHGEMVDILCPKATRERTSPAGSDIDSPTPGSGRRESRTAPRYTDLQGQYLAFIYLYSKLHRQPPAEADIRAYFRVSPPSVHQMILTLERRGLIERTPGMPRSIRVLLPMEDLPDLAD